MSKYRIEFERNKCVGTTACVEECPDNWEIKEDGKSMFKVKDFDDDKIEGNMAAAKACPVKIIHIYNNQTNQKLI